MRILNFKFRLQENYGKQAILKMYKLYGIKYGIGTIYDVYGQYIEQLQTLIIKEHFDLVMFIFFYSEIIFVKAKLCKLFNYIFSQYVNNLLSEHICVNDLNTSIK